MPSPVIPILSCIAFILISGFFLRWGWRFRSEQIPATCRKCGYDISQRPPGVERCSECGSDLTAAQAITEIRRRKNWWMIVPAGVVMLALFISLIGFIIDYPWSPWFDANAPTSLIIRLAKHNRATSGDHYRDAWINRQGTSPELVKHLLDLQADPKAAWNDRWGQLLVKELQAGGLDPQQRKQFLNLFFGPATFTVRTTVRQGDPLPISAAWTTRGTYASSVLIRIFFAARADGPATIDPHRYLSVGMNYPGRSRTIDAQDWGAVHLTPGRHKVRLALGCEILKSPDLSGPLDARPSVGERIEQHADFDIDVLPASALLGTSIPAPEKAVAIAQATSVHVFHWHDDRAFAEITLLKAPVDRAFAVFTLIDGKETKLGSVAAAQNALNISNALYIPISVERAKATEKMTIILVGDGDSLKFTLTQQNYWPGRIIFPDVPLEKWIDYQRYISGKQPGPSTLPYRIEPAKNP